MSKIQTIFFLFFFFNCQLNCPPLIYSWRFGPLTFLRCSTGVQEREGTGQNVGEPSDFPLMEARLSQTDDLIDRR